MASPFNEAAERLRKQVAEETPTSGEDFLLERLCVESLSGDASLLKYIAGIMCEKVVFGVPLEASDRLWICNVLSRINHNSDAANLLCGKSKIGAPRKGALGIAVAVDVFNAIYDGAPSAEEAWARVAEARNLSVPAVKKKWSEWKPLVEGYMREAVLATGAEDLSAALKIITKKNRDKK